MLPVTEDGLTAETGLVIKITLTTGMLGHVSQINTEIISTYIFRPIKAFSPDILPCVIYNVSPPTIVYLH